MHISSSYKSNQVNFISKNIMLNSIGDDLTQWTLLRKTSFCLTNRSNPSLIVYAIVTVNIDPDIFSYFIITSFLLIIFDFFYFYHFSPPVTTSSHILYHLCTRLNSSQITCIIFQIVTTYQSNVVSLIVQNGFDYTLNTLRFCNRLLLLVRSPPMLLSRYFSRYFSRYKHDEITFYN